MLAVVPVSLPPPRTPVSFKETYASSYSGGLGFERAGDSQSWVVDIAVPARLVCDAVYIQRRVAANETLLGYVVWGMGGPSKVIMMVGRVLPRGLPASDWA